MQKFTKYKVNNQNTRKNIIIIVLSCVKNSKIQPEAYSQEQMGCLEDLQNQLDTDQEIFLETGMASEVYETQQQGKTDYLFPKISSVALQQHWHFVCLAMDVSLLQRYLPESSFCHYDVSNKSHLG